MTDINDIKVRPGWTKSIQRNKLVIQKIVEFDIETMMGVPFFVAPITIEEDQRLTVNLYDFRGYHTDGLYLSDAIVTKTLTVDDIVP